jgi:hypothetical protein
MAKVITENFKVETTNELYKSFKNENSNLSDSFIEQLKVYDASSSTLTLDENADIPEIKKLVDGQLELLRPESNYYIMASTTLTSTAGIPSVADTQKQKRDFQRKIIFGNKVSDSSARYMFFENEWKTGTIYDAFDDTVDLATKNTIVTVQTTEGEYLAFKCLENNGGAPSTINPQEEIAQFVSSNYQSVETSDKYIWHYMFTVSADEAEKYKSFDSLPLPASGGNADVIANATESISQIIVESTPVSQYNQYLFGEATSEANASDVLMESSTISQGITYLTLSTTTKVGRTLYNDSDSYKYMYFRSAANGATQGKLYDVLSSSTAGNKLVIGIKTNDSIPASSVGQLVIKIEVSSSTLTGVRCKAYGILDQFGTLRRVAFETKGTEYKFATAKVVHPKSLTSPGTTTLRAVVSPRGGHGSSPIEEMAMSRLSVLTNFVGSSSLVPTSNFYTQVGLVKNPTFTDSTGTAVQPSAFDNRVVVDFSSDVSADISENKFIEQFIREISVSGIRNSRSYVVTDPGNMSLSEWNNVSTKVDGNAHTTIPAGTEILSKSNATNAITSSFTGKVSEAVDSVSIDEDGETITGKVHEVVVDSTTNPSTTKVYLVDCFGNFKSRLHPGILRIKDTATSTNATTIAINSFNDISYGQYNTYSGDLLHYIDFAPIERKVDTREKVKFTFDF